MKNKLIIISFLLSIGYTQVYNLGDTVPSDFGLPWCGNNPMDDDSLFLGKYDEAINETGRPYVIWLMAFTTW